MKLHKLLNLVLILLVLAACQPVTPAVPVSSTNAQTTATEAPTTQGNNPQDCITDFDAQQDYFPDKVEALYTEQWSVTYHNHYKVITINSTYDNPATEPVVER